ncbi:MAG: tRNA epoxyqueuosine(34) reductase QueG [Acidobacteriota bacterium]
MRNEDVTRIAHDCGFELAGVATAGPVADFPRYAAWVERGDAGEMRYLTDHRAQIRSDVRNLLPSARSVICVGKLYNATGPEPQAGDAEISRYAWGRDYHEVMKASLEEMTRRLLALESFEYKVCVDTAPLLERSLAREAGLGWIGKNTCLINEPRGSWFFLGEIVTSLELEADAPPADRCGSCTRCIEACPTQALVPEGDQWTLDSRRCISYLTIELRGPIPEEMHAGIGTHVFGCDICQDVCPWNRRAPVTSDAAFQGSRVTLEEIAGMTAEEFRVRFRGTPVWRTKQAGMLRNVEIAMKNATAAPGDE